MLLVITMLFLNILLVVADHNLDNEHCDIDPKTCKSSANLDDQKYLFYDINPSEGFNLRRDVYMRFATMLAEAHRGGKHLKWRLVLPPWYQLYHWKTRGSPLPPIYWNNFFDVNSLKSYAPILELHEVFTRTPTKSLEMDVIYVLQNYADPFEGGEFKEKWEERFQDCVYDGNFWGYNNVTAKEIICVKFQGKISQLWQLIALHPNANKIMFDHSEIPLHDSYGTKAYWECRKSMKFNKRLVDTAKEFINKHFDCNTDKCASYLSVHWRRQDFARSRSNDVPTINGTVTQINRIIKKQLPHINKIFIASDASKSELQELNMLYNKFHYETYVYVPSLLELDSYKDGGVAIIDQIICSHAAYFIGTHESTFSFRIQEEREIIGFDSGTTFNRLCPDKGKCSRPSKWTIVN